MTRHLERLSLYLLLVVIALRPLIAESYHSSRTAISAALALVADPLPVTTLVIDAVILAAALCWLVSRAIGQASTYRRCGIEWGAVLVMVAGVASCCVAGNRRTAINATVDWLCLPLLAIVLVQVLRHRWHIRLTLCVILASAAVQAGECFNQIFYAFPETQQMYEADKAAFWAAANVEPDSPKVALYERRIYGREATGYLTHSNVTGAYLVTAWLAALGFAWARWRSPRAPLRRALAVGVLVLASAMSQAALYTRSKGALVAGSVGLLLCIICLVFRSRLQANRRKALAIGWGLVVLAGLATIGHGLHHGRLPGSSLNFRWQYWTTSWNVFGDHPVTGVGRENFGDHYLKYKTIDSPEEVTNPHNFLVTTATEWGSLGVIGVVVMLVGGSVAATRVSPARSDVPVGRAGSPLIWGAAICGVTFFVRLFLQGSDQVPYLVYVTVVPLIVWVIAFAVCSTESNRLGAFHDDVLPGLATGINCGLVVFLLQDTINFALFVPGAATTFFALLAVAIADCRMRTAECRTGAAPAGAAASPGAGCRGVRWLVAAAAGVVLVVHVGWLLVPVARAGGAISRARADADKMVPGGFEVQPAYTAYLRAAEVDPLDPTPLAEAGGYLVAYAQAGPDPLQALRQAFELIDAAIERDPYNTTLHRQKLRMYRRAFDVTGDRTYLQAAIGPARRVVELYPQSPPDLAALGTALLEAGRHATDAKLLAQSVEHLTRALDLDDARPPWEELRRFHPRQRHRIETDLATASRLLGDRP